MYQSVADDQAKLCLLDLLRQRNSDPQYQEKLAIEDCVRACFHEFVEPFYSGKLSTRIRYNGGRSTKDNLDQTELPSVLEVTMQSLKNVGFKIENIETQPIWHSGTQDYMYVIEFDVLFNGLN